MPCFESARFVLMIQRIITVQIIPDPMAKFMRFDHPPSSVTGIGCFSVTEVREVAVPVSIIVKFIILLADVSAEFHGLVIVNETEASKNLFQRVPRLSCTVHRVGCHSLTRCSGR